MNRVLLFLYTAIFMSLLLIGGIAMFLQNCGLLRGMHG